MSDRGNVVRLPREPLQRSEPFRPFYASQLAGYTPPAPEWLIDGVLLRGTVAVIGGSPGIGKSMLLQQSLSTIALGADWFGRQTMPCRCFGLFCEDPDAQLKRRQLAILAHLNRDAGDLEMEISFDSRDGKDALLVEFDRYSAKPKFTPLWDQLWAFVADDGINVVGIDTAATVFSGNEVSREQVTAFMRELQRKAVEIQGAIIMTAHPAKNSPNGISGSNAWLASARSGMSLGRPADWDPDTGEPVNVRVLRGLKNNYGPSLTAERLEYEDGVFVAAEPEHAAGKHGPLTHTERQDLKYRLLMGMKRVILNGGHVPADELDPRSMPSRARRQTDPSIARVALNDLYRAQQELVEGGLAVRVRVGGKVLLRPHDGPWYESEEPFIPPPPPKVGA